MAASIPLHPLHELQRIPLLDRPLVRLAQRPQLQHHPGPARRPAAVRPRVEQRYIILLHFILASLVPDGPFGGGHPSAQLAGRGEVSGPGNGGWVPVQRVGEGGVHLVL